MDADANTVERQAQPYKTTA